MIWKPHVTVAAIAEHRGQFLLVEERVSGKLVINQPAGHLEQGESLVDAVVRETLEETGWHFSPSALVGVYRWQQPGRERTFLRFAFCGSLSDHDARRPLDAGIVRTLWLPRDHLASRQEQLRGPMVLASIDDYLRGERHALSLFNDLLGNEQLPGVRATRV